MADAATNWSEKSDLFQIERRWLAQARKIRAKPLQSGRPQRPAPEGNGKG